jgi:hypothetical protein
MKRSRRTKRSDYKAHAAKLYKLDCAATEVYRTYTALASFLLFAA